MAKIKFVPDDGYERDVPLPPFGAPRRVVPGQVIEVPADAVYGFTCQDIWEAADADAKKAHKAAEGGDESAPAENEE